MIALYVIAHAYAAAVIIAARDELIASLDTAEATGGPG